jgi:hypothetical protein
MNEYTRYRRLIDETLSFSRMSPISPESCMVTNAAAKDLKNGGLEALQEIEETIRADISRDARNCADHHELLGKHLGLINLWVAYFAIGADRQTARIVQFLRSLDDTVVATAILAMKSIWLEKSPNAIMPGPFVEFVREVAGLRTGSVPEVARCLLQDQISDTTSEVGGK